MKNKAKQKMSIWGIGPIFTFLSIAYSVIIFLLSRHFYPMFKIKFISYHILFFLGIFLIIIGVLFFIVSLITIIKAYNSNTLVTNGVFGCCRHPLYASWIVFIVPGMVLLANSWIGLTAPVFMYLIVRILVRKEEDDLYNTFGSKYLKYKEKVPSIIPYGCLYKLNSKYL